MVGPPARQQSLMPDPEHPARLSQFTEVMMLAGFVRAATIYGADLSKLVTMAFERADSSEVAVAGATIGYMQACSDCGRRFKAIDLWMSGEICQRLGDRAVVEAFLVSYIRSGSFIHPEALADAMVWHRHASCQTQTVPQHDWRVPARTDVDAMAFELTGKRLITDADEGLRVQLSLGRELGLDAGLLRSVLVQVPALLSSRAVLGGIVSFLGAEVALYVFSSAVGELAERGTLQ